MPHARTRTHIITHVYFNFIYVRAEGAGLDLRSACTCWKSRFGRQCLLAAACTR